MIVENNQYTQFQFMTQTITGKQEQTTKYYSSLKKNK